MKRKWSILLTILIVLIAAAILIIPRFTKYHLPIAIKAKPKEINKEFLFIKQKAKELKQYCKSHQYSTSFACILDMNQHSGKSVFMFMILKKTLLLVQVWWHMVVAMNIIYLKQNLAIKWAVVAVLMADIK